MCIYLLWAVITRTLYFYLALCRKESLSFPECNKYFFPRAFYFFPPFTLSLTLSITHLDIRCADCSCRNGTWSNTFDQLQFAANPLQEPRTFSFNIAFALCAVTKFIQQSVCCASNAAHSCGWHVHLLSDEHEPPLQSPHLFGSGEVAFLHRRNMHTYIQTQVPLLRPILGYLSNFPMFHYICNHITVRRVQSHETISILIHHSLA